MGTIWVREFAGGLDTRRLVETSESNTLLKADNCHISRGGEVDKRYSFASAYTLPAGTVGMARDSGSLYVFGHTVAPVGMPAGVTYQRLVNPDNANSLVVRVPSFDLFQGLLYVVAEFDDGSRHHFYDGTVVTDWYDGKASASFDITAGMSESARGATGSFRIAGGTVTTSTLDTVTVAGSAAMGAAVAHTGDNNTTATAVAAAITSFFDSTLADYTAVAVDDVVFITSVSKGPGVDGRVVATTVSAGFVVADVTNLADGAFAVTSEVSDILVDGVSLLSAPVVWGASNTATAAAVAAEITGTTSAPNYTATSSGTRVTVTAALAGAAPNGLVLDTVLAGGIEVRPATGATLAGGSDDAVAYDPGSFVQAVTSKMYAVAGPNLQFSGIRQPTMWTTNAVGAGFIDLSGEGSGFDDLTALARYREYVVVFADRGVQIWFVDPDPALTRITQTLSNTGTSAPNSVTQFGDEDVFYLDESGLRSLKSRAALNLAATTDIGVPIDTIITAKLQSLTATERRFVFGLIEPVTGRFWLVMKDTIYVFTFFQGSKISAWSTYVTTDAAGAAFNVEYATVFDRRVYLRSGNTIYCYGGVATGMGYDANTVADIWLPYLDAERPTAMKSWDALDVACLGEWEVSVGMNPRTEALADEELVGRVWRTTYNEGAVPFEHDSTHVSLRFRSVGTGAHKLGSVVVNYQGTGDAR